MTRLTLIAIMAAVVGYQATTTSASASPITYDLVGVTAAYNTETDVFSGSFTLDPSTYDLSAVAITVSGDGPDTGSFDTPDPRPFPEYQYQVEFADSSGDMWILSFFDIFADASNPLSAIYNSDPTVLTNAVTGEAVPTPLPAALPLFAAGLGALGLFGWRRKRKGAAAIAAV
jgi:hypothetical protein